MRAARLKNRVELQAYTETQTDTGFPTKTWTTVATVSAAVEAIRGREAEAIGEMVATQSTRIIIRSSPEVSGVDETYRILLGTRVFSIESVVGPTDRGGITAYIEMMCVEGKKDGG